MDAHSQRRWMSARRWHGRSIQLLIASQVRARPITNFELTHDRVDPLRLFEPLGEEVGVSLLPQDDPEARETARAFWRSLVGYEPG